MLHVAVRWLSLRFSDDRVENVEADTADRIKRRVVCASNMSVRVVLLSVCALFCVESIQSQHAVQQLHAGNAARRLQQSALKINARDPVSATTADLVDDPTGRGHLLVWYSGPMLIVVIATTCRREPARHQALPCVSFFTP